MTEHTFSGRVVVVTGAASGIGLACAQQFARQRAKVVLLDVDRSGLETAIRSMDAPTSPVAMTCDVADREAVGRVFQAIASDGKIDVLVNCAGINRLKRNFACTSTEDWDAVVAVNLSGMFYCCHAVIEGMRRRGGGTIINFASWAGRHAGYFTGPAYNATKRAVLALTESINIEEGLNGLRATAIVPEEVATAIVDKRPVPPTAEERARMLLPEDVARSVVFAAAQPARVCINELVISPVYNRAYLGLHPTALTSQHESHPLPPPGVHHGMPHQHRFLGIEKGRAA
jgi:NAD(P)-dependent dehydrogenase (short-subunit alcohol dehydrogenase family)